MVDCLLPPTQGRNTGRRRLRENDEFPHQNLSERSSLGLDRHLPKDGVGRQVPLDPRPEMPASPQGVSEILLPALACIPWNLSNPARGWLAPVVLLLCTR